MEKTQKSRHMYSVAFTPIKNFVNWCSDNFYINTVAIVLVFLFIERLLRRVAILPVPHYFESILFVEVFKRMSVWILLAGLVTIAVMMKRGFILSKWGALENGDHLRKFITFLCAVLAWPLVTLDFNMYFFQGYNLDKALLAVVAICVYWRPVFVFPFLLLSFPLLYQISQLQLGGSVIAHKIQVLNILTIFASAFTIFCLSGHRKTGPLLLVTCSLVASAYWAPALAKLSINWLDSGGLYLSQIAAFSNGWLSFYSYEGIVELSRLIAPFDKPMMWFVLSIEAACLVLLINRQVPYVLLTLLCVFHLGVFYILGFLFWTWIIADIALMWLLAKDYKEGVWKIFGNYKLLTSTLLILLCQFWAKPPKLGWHETQVNYTYHLQAETSNGLSIRLPAEFFGPYDDIFTMVSFSYLVKEHSVLVSSYGITKDLTLAKKINSTTNANQLFVLEKQSNFNNFNEKRAKRLHQFITTYMSNYNRIPDYTNPLEWLKPPRQFWSFKNNISTIQGQIIESVQIVEKTTFFDGEKLQVIRELPISTICITCDREDEDGS